MTLPLWFVLTMLLLALVMVPVLVLTGAWIAHSARTGKSPLPSRPRKAKEPPPQAPRFERPDVRP